VICRITTTNDDKKGGLISMKGEKQEKGIGTLNRVWKRCHWLKGTVNTTGSNPACPILEKFRVVDQESTSDPEARKSRTLRG
jgi:hypothetical protein